MTSKTEVIRKATSEGKKVHFATLMDLCHLKNPELEKKFQRHKGRVVLRCDVVKDDSRNNVVFTEQGASRSHMTVAKSPGRHFKITRLFWTSS